MIKFVKKKINYFLFLKLFRLNQRLRYSMLNLEEKKVKKKPIDFSLKNGGQDCDFNLLFFCLLELLVKID